MQQTGNQPETSPTQPPRIFKNFGLLLSGRVGAAIFTVITMSLMARELSVASFGLVILVHTYVMIVNGIISTKAFEVIVKYGLPLRLRDDHSQLKNLFCSSFLLDCVLAICSCLVAIALAPLVGAQLGSGAVFAEWMAVYGLVLLFTGTSTAKGILRMYDRFAALGIQLSMGPLLRLLVAVLAWWMGWGEVGFLAAWGLGFLCENLILHWQAWREVRRKLPAPVWRRPNYRSLLAEQPDMLSFAGVTYVQGTLDLLPKQIATLLSGLFLGPAAAGLFRVAREVATIVSKPALLLRQAIFTDLTRLWEQRDPEFYRLPLRTAALTGTGGLVLALLAIPFGDQLLVLMFGEKYQQSHWLLVILLLAASMELATSSLHMAAYAMGKASRILLVNVAATLVYLLAFALLTPPFGLLATGWAACLMAGISLAGAFWLSVIRRPQGSAAASE